MSNATSGDGEVQDLSEAKSDNVEAVEQEPTSLEPVRDKRPPVSRGEKRRLLRDLKRAARLLRRKQLSESQYGVIVISTSQRLAGRVAEGESFRGKEFDTFSSMTEDFWELVVSRSGGDLEKSLSRFGPWNMAGLWAAGDLRELQPQHLIRDLFRFEWNEKADDLLEEGQLRLRRWPRSKFAYEERLARNRKYFPHTTEVLSKIGFAVFGAAFGTLVTLLITMFGLLG